MAGALQTAVLGMRAYQEMLDVSGHNIANADTVAFKESRITFADVFSRTLRQGTAPSGSLGGTNPIQIGQGVTVAGVDKNMSQGGFTASGKDFDIAIDGEGFFTVSDADQFLYTRDGTFDVDTEGVLVDTSTGYLVQRIGTVGEQNGFQVAGDASISIPYNTELPGTHTTLIDFKGNLSAGDKAATSTRLQGTGSPYTLTAGGLASAGTEFADVDQLNGFTDGDTIDISGRQRDGTAVAATFTYGGGGDGTTLGDLLASIETAFGGGSAVTASMDEGKIVLADDQAGYSLLDLELNCAVSGLEDTMPADFDYLDVGGVAAQTTNISIYDRQGQTHSLTASFVRQSSDRNVWDLVINGCAGTDRVTDRRIAGIRFDDTGTYQGINGEDGFGNLATDPGFEEFDSDFSVLFPAIGTEQALAADFGRIGFHDGLFQLGGESSAGATMQDGYGRGSLQSITIDGSGLIRGTFSNGVTLDIASMRLAVFDNVGGLQTIGSNYYAATPAAGSIIYSRGMEGRAGRVRQNVLEDSNVDIAREFTRLIVAQRGFQVNSRTVGVTNNMFQNLTMLVT